MKPEEYVTTLEDMNVVLTYLKVLKRRDFRSGRFSHETHEMPCAIYAPETKDFMAALYEHGFIAAFDWTPWQEDVEAYMFEGKPLDNADLQVVQERFWDGAVPLGRRSSRECGPVACVIRQFAVHCAYGTHLPLHSSA